MIDRKLFAEHGIRCPVLLQEKTEVASAYQARGTPTGYLIDAQGQIASDLTVGAPDLLGLVKDPSSAKRTAPKKQAAGGGCGCGNGNGKATNGYGDGKVNKGLEASKLNRSGLVLVIKCGRLNSQMPAFDKFAYSDGRCYGKKQADLKSYPTRMPDPPATLQQREIDLIVDFLMAKIVGKGQMDHAKCVEFWGSETDACKEFPK